MEIFSRWEPPTGMEIKGIWARPDGGGFGLFEVTSAEVVYEATAPWSEAYLDYDISPIVEIEMAVELLNKGIAQSTVALSAVAWETVHSTRNDLDLSQGSGPSHCPPHVYKMSPQGRVLSGNGHDQEHRGRGTVWRDRVRLGWHDQRLR